MEAKFSFERLSGSRSPRFNYRERRAPKEMKMNCELRGWGARTWMLWFVGAGFIVGCGTATKTATPTSSNVLHEPPAFQSTDQSWAVDDYMRAGMPDPNRLWTAADYRGCRDILYALDRTNRAALPRMESSKSGSVFARMINVTNTLSLADRFLPSEERVRLFYAVLNRLPAFRDIYRLNSSESAFHRETIELDHIFLRMLGSAVEWDGKTLPASAGETRSVTFQLSELSRTPIESLLALSPAQSVVPRGDRFIVVGAYSAVTLRSRLPWLADGTGLPDSNRLRAIHYLREDIPPLWPHLSSSQQRESVGDLDEVLRRTRHEEIRRELEAFRGQLPLR
jgi:hypothetical protein